MGPRLSRTGLSGTTRGHGLAQAMRRCTAQLHSAVDRIAAADGYAARLRGGWPVGSPLPTWHALTARPSAAHAMHASAASRDASRGRTLECRPALRLQERVRGMVRRHRAAPQAARVPSRAQRIDRVNQRTPLAQVRRSGPTTALCAFAHAQHSRTHARTHAHGPPAQTRACDEGHHSACSGSRCSSR